MKIRFTFCLLLCFLLSFQAYSLIASPVQDDDTRGMWDSGFLKKRPPAHAATAAKKHVKYHRSTPKVFASVGDPKSKVEDTQSDKAVIGVTFWKWRRSMKTDDKAVRLLVREDDKMESEWTPFRVESDTIFAPGDKVRLSFESPRDGYLYVIDREQYADGKMSEPYLIFPTLQDYNGNNKVTAGRVIDIPRIKPFTLKSKNPAYAGEMLTFIVTPQPLEGVTVPPDLLKLDEEKVKGWEQNWSTKFEKFELEEGTGKTYTKAEKEAGENASRLLTQEDDMPQTLFVVEAKPGTPILFTVNLKIQK